MLRTIFSHQTSKPPRWILLMDESLHLLMVGRFSHYLEGFLYIQTVVVWDFWTINTCHPLMLPERWTPSSPRCFRDGGVAVCFFAQHGNSPFFWNQKFARNWSVMFFFTFPKGNLFWGGESSVFIFSTWNIPPKKPHITGQDPANQGRFKHI